MRTAIRKHLGDPNLERIAFSMQPGQVSPIIQVADTLFIDIEVDVAVADNDA